MSNNDTIHSPECDANIVLDYPSFFQALSLFICIILFRFITDEYVLATYTNILDHIHSIRELLANVQASLRLALYAFASQIYATVLVLPMTAFQKGTYSLAEACSRTNYAIAYNKVSSDFAFCLSVLQTCSSVMTSCLNGIVSHTSVLQPYCAIIASYTSGPYTNASDSISNTWSNLKIRHIVANLPFQTGTLRYLTVLASQPCSKDMSLSEALSEVILALIRPLRNYLVAYCQEVANNYSQLDPLEFISFCGVLGYLAYLINGRLVFGHNTGLFRELQCTPAVRYFSRAFECLSTAVAHPNRSIRRLGRHSKAWLQDSWPNHLSSYVCRVGQCTKAWLQIPWTTPSLRSLLFSMTSFVLDSIVKPIRRVGQEEKVWLQPYLELLMLTAMAVVVDLMVELICRVGQSAKAWLQTSLSTPNLKLLLSSTKAFVIELIVELICWRLEALFPAKPWPSTPITKYLVRSIALPRFVKGLGRLSARQHSSWQRLSLFCHGGLRYCLRLPSRMTLADVVDVLITLVCLAVFLAIALFYQVVLFTMAVQFLEKMFSVSILNKLTY